MIKIPKKVNPLDSKFMKEKFKNLIFKKNLIPKDNGKQNSLLRTNIKNVLLAVMTII